MAQSAEYLDVNIVDSTISLENYNNQVLRLHGDWKFKPLHLKNINLDEFEKLKPMPVDSGNLHFLNFNENPKKGSYILRIIANKGFRLSIANEGFVAQVQFLHIHKKVVTLLYEDNGFKKKSYSNSRKQISRTAIDFNIKPGTNFLIYNYKQQPIEKSGKFFINAGLVGGVMIGPPDTIHRNHEKANIWLLVPLGIVICLAIYSLMIYFSRHREDYDSFFLFFFNFVIALKEVASQNLLSRFFDDRAFIQFSSIGLSGPLIAATIAIAMLYRKYSSKYLRILIYLHGGNSALCLIHGIISPTTTFLPISTFLHPLFVIINALIFFLLFIPYAIVIAIKVKQTEIGIFTVGILMLALGTFVDFVNLYLGLNWPWVSMWGSVLMSILFSINNSLLFANAFDSSKKLNIELGKKNIEVENLNRDLEHKVKVRTSEIRSLLECIPHGILSIGKGGIVGSNYSAQLITLLGHQNIANCDIRDVLLKHSLISDDQKDQIWQTLSCTISESLLNFEANQNKLLAEFEYQSGHEKKYFHLTWNVQMRDTDIIEHILVTILDITSEVEARSKLAEKNRDLRIISQLIDIGAENANNFFSAATKMLDENEVILTFQGVNPEQIKTLFVNMHTLKGGARTLRLIDLADVFHSLENSYSQAIKDRSSIDQIKFISELEFVRSLFMHYQHINSNVLGRVIDDRLISIDRETLNNTHRLLSWIDRNNLVPVPLRSYLKSNNENITKLIYSSLSSILDDILKQIPPIAMDLQKPTPHIIKDIEDILIEQKEEQMLRNAFVHILRNSIDHGIESTDERKAKGKDETGTITIRSSTEPEFHYIELEDNGRGLAVGKLRERGIKNGTLNNESSLDSIVETIFNQGVSTKDTISIFSGRGIGMNAVRQFIQSQGGDVYIKLKDESLESGYYSFSLILKLKNSNFEANDFSNFDKIA